MWQLVGMYLVLVELFAWARWEPLDGVRSPYLSWADLGSIPVGIIIIAILIWLRPAFAGRVRQGSWTAAASVFALGLFITGYVSYYLVDSVQPDGTVTSVRDVMAALARSAGLRFPWSDLIAARLPAWIPQITSWFFGLTVLAVVWVFLRTVRDPHGWTPEREVALRELLHTHGATDSLGYFATRRDRSVIFSPDGRAAVSYRLCAGVCVAAGNPVGDPASWRAAIDAWLAEAARHGWIPAVVSADEASARAYVAAGLLAIGMGDEAVVDEWRLATAKATDPGLRRAIRHVASEGVTIKVRRQQQLTASELAEVSAVADSWRKGGPERGFSMALGRSGDWSDGRTLLVTAHAGQRLVGLLSLVPWGTSGASLDLMRRSPDAPHGVTEAMVAGLLDRSSRVGLKRVSLNFCMFRRVFEDAQQLGAGRATRLNSSILGFLDRFWQVERLYASNRRYHPEWVPRYLCYPEVLSLPRSLVAVGMLEGFLPYSGVNRVATSPAPALAAVHALEAKHDVDFALQARRPNDQYKVRRSHLAQLEASG